MLSGFTKPVIFTAGSVLSEVFKKNQRIQDVLNNYEFLSLRANIINALQVVNYEVPEISLIFGNRLIKAVKSISGQDKVSIFDSIDEPLGRVAFSINVNKKAIKKKTVKLKLETAINENVVCLKVYPGFSAQIVEDLSAIKDGIVLDFNDQSITIAGLEKINTHHKAIVLYNQPCLRHNRKFIEVSNILPHVLVIKLMWALGQTRAISRLKRLLLTNRCGEFLK
jgi:L-asparaginase/Glu-tRNA(Gln) amidotransferase subunit D